MDLLEDTPLPILPWFTLPLLLTLLPRSTLTRSPPTHTTTPSLTTTPPPTSMLPSPVTELAVPRVLTVSTFLTAAPSMLATPPTPSTDTSLQSPMTELLSIPILLLFTLPLLTLPPLSTLLLSFTLLQLFTLLPLSTTPVLLARALTNLSPSLTREKRGALARPRHPDPPLPLYPLLIPSVTQLRLVWPLILVRELLVRDIQDRKLLESQQSAKELNLLPEYLFDYLSSIKSKYP